VPQRFITAPSETCAQVMSSLDRTVTKLDAWYKVNAVIPAAQRSSAENVLWNMAARVLSEVADDWDQLGRSSQNPIIEDFLAMGSQYYRAFVAAIPSYVSADNQLYQVGRFVGTAVKSACLAAQG
jgi:hypothetical protein